MKKTYIDSGVLIEAFRGTNPSAVKALRILDDPDRKFVVSDYLRLEVLPKPIFHKRKVEIDFMQAFLDGAAENLSTSPEVTGRALEYASKYDLRPVDALHVGAAAVAGVDEFVTLERPTKPICKVKEVKVVSIHPESEAVR